MGTVERYFQQQVTSFVGMLVKAIMAIFVVFWPMAFIVGDAFGKHPGVLAWTVGSAAQLVWLVILGAFWVSRQKKRETMRQGRLVYTHGTCTIQHRTPGAGRCKERV